MTAPRYPRLRDALAALVHDALGAIARTEPGPRFVPVPDQNGWRRHGQDTLTISYRKVWDHPYALSDLRWWHRLPTMAAVDALLDEHQLRARVDTPVGFPFGTGYRGLGTLLTVYLLTPQVQASDSYDFDPVLFEACYARVEDGLLQETVHLVDLVPLLGFDCALPEVEVPGGMVIRQMTAAELSAAVQVLGVPVDSLSPTSVRVLREYQYALVKVYDFPIQIGHRDAAQGQLSPPAPLIEQARLLVTALRLVCGGSVTLGRPVRMQGSEDFDPTMGSSAERIGVELPDPARRTSVYEPVQVELIANIHRLLALPAVAEDRALQLALRRIVTAGSRALPVDRLIDLLIAAEALFLQRAGIRSRDKAAPIAAAATSLLAEDPVVGAAPALLEQLFRDVYRRRNYEMHADTRQEPELHLLSGATAPTLAAVIADLEIVMRRAVLAQMLRSLSSTGATAAAADAL